MDRLRGPALQRLLRRRILSRQAVAGTADGERRTSAAGSGIEFADHRQYQSGDDLRHVDPHAYARLGRPYVKRFVAHRGLDVAVMVDVSDSMRFGRPTKIERAGELARALALVAISGGDRVRVAAFGTGSDVRWRPAVASTERVEPLIRGLLARSVQATETDLRALAHACERVLPRNGITVVLSDWWTADPVAAATAFARAGRELVAIQIVAPEEEEPDLLGSGPARLVDAESGDSADLPLTPDAVAAYRRALAEWRERLETSIVGSRGRLFHVRTDQPLEDVLNGWRESQFVA